MGLWSREWRHGHVCGSHGHVCGVKVAASRTSFRGYGKGDRTRKKLKMDILVKTRNEKLLLNDRLDFFQPET